MTGNGKMWKAECGKSARVFCGMVMGNGLVLGLGFGLVLGLGLVPHHHSAKYLLSMY